MMLGGALALDVVLFLTGSALPASYGATISRDVRTAETSRRPIRQHDACTTCLSAAAPASAARR